MAALLDRPGPGPGEAAAVLAALVLVEAAVVLLLPVPGPRAQALAYTGALRLAETALVLVYWKGRGWALEDLGLRGARVPRGLAVGACFAGGMAVTVALAETVARVAVGASVLARLAGTPPSPGELGPLLAAGVLAGPVFEELVFRGVLYGGLRRRLPPLPAAGVVTALFTLAHLLSTRVPWVQAVGGLLFCAAYELAGSLWAPVLLHAAGNLALFLLPFAFHGG